MDRVYRFLMKFLPVSLSPLSYAQGVIVKSAFETISFALKSPAFPKFDH